MLAVLPTATFGQSDPLDLSPLAAQGEMHEAFQYGAQAYRQGNTEAAVIALEKAAEGGHVVALWKLGRMYSEGDGVDRDHSRAFRIFHRIANEFADANPFHESAPAIANAFVELATYYAEGISDTIEPNTIRAAGLLQHAASYFGNTEAQYRLGRMYADRASNRSDVVVARKWLGLAAEKGHVEAQANLGHLLWTGRGDRSFPIQGLAWLIVACERAVGTAALQTQPLCEEAFTSATQTQYNLAELSAQNWRERYAKR
ncbi:MAG: tetratricopeptide repeat protein [Pseudomonadota bacterium]